MKYDHTTNPFRRWLRDNPQEMLDKETNIRISQWTQVSHQLLDLFKAFDDEIDPWLKGQQSPQPDLVAFIAGYGYSRTATGDWKDLPIDIPSDQVADWDENTSLVASIDQLHDYQAGVAGSVAEMLCADQDRFVATTKKQLGEHYDELGSLTNKPITEFKPTQWEYEDLGEEHTGWEVEELDRIFDLYEKLWCFEQGIEELRMLMITEDDPEFHLPNVGFFEALKSINSHELVMNLAHAEPKLREILKLWSNTIMRQGGKPYHRPYDNAAPKVFWWRHKDDDDKRPPRRPQNNGRNHSQNSRRPDQNCRPTK